jgi:threonyl-tRNA synthetase
VWLSPLQVKILPISDKFLSYATEVKAKLRKVGVRVEIDERQEKIGKKIREAELSRVPYMLVLGEKEMNENTLSIRRQGKGDMGQLPVDEFIRNIVSEIEEKKSGE